MKRYFRTIQSVLDSRWGNFHYSGTSAAQKTDRILQSSKLEDCIYRDLSSDDENIHNMGHATCAYLGGYVGRKYIYQAIDDPEILSIVENAMLESAMALSQKYGVELEPLMLHITDLLGRFRNEALKDTCKRVGGDPARKLGAADRLIGSSLLCLEMGVTPAYIAVGAAGAVYRYLNETGTEQSYDAAKQVLGDISGLPDEHSLTEMIMQMYGLYLEGETVAAMRRYAQNVKAAKMHEVI